MSTWLVVASLVLLLSPLILLAGALGAVVLGRPQPRLIAQALVAYCARELVVLLAAGGLWLLSGLGRTMRSPRSQRRHRRLLRWFVRGGAQRLSTILDVRVDPQPTPEAERALAADRPLVFLSRHAGPGDTLFLVDLLMSRYDRHPSLVFKRALVIDPVIDLLTHRLPHAILDTADPEECEARIAEVSGDLGARGVLVLFPEGGNVTPERRLRALGRLRRKGRVDEAAAGEAMRHVMPPRPTGVQAALRGNPEADVVFAAHTGLGLATFVRELWREVPIGQTLTARMWLAPAAERPTDPDEQVEWLYGWWRRLDDWVDAQGEAPLHRSS